MQKLGAATPRLLCALVHKFDPADLKTDLGPMIDANAFQKILEYIEIGTQEGQLILGGKTLDINGGDVTITNQGK